MQLILKIDSPNIILPNGNVFSSSTLTPFLNQYNILSVNINSRSSYSFKIPFFFFINLPLFHPVSSNGFIINSDIGGNLIGDFLIDIIKLKERYIFENFSY